MYKAFSSVRRALLRGSIVLLVALSLGSGGSGFSAVDFGVQEARAATPSVLFVPNVGQVIGNADFVTTGGTFTTYLNDKGLYFVTRAEQDGSAGRWTTAVEFVGAHQGVHPVSIEESGAAFNYFRGPQAEWKTGVAASTAVTYRELWSGIDLTVKGDEGTLKYEFSVAPGADANQIQMAYRGAEVTLNSSGQLELKTPAGVLVDHAPVATQNVDGSETEVAVAYDLASNAGQTVVGFLLGSYDTTRTLVIDPAVTTYVSYVGGTGSEDAVDVRLDTAGNILHAGTAFSDGMFSGVPGFDDTNDGGSDAYVVKYSADGSSLLWGTYIGGSSNDTAFGLAVDGSNNAYVVGRTFSRSTFQIPDEGFPATLGAFDTTYDDTNGTTYPDSFVCKIAAAGTSLGFCSYLGGDYAEHAFGVAVDSLNRAYIVGVTASTETQDFPVTTGSFDETFNNAGPHSDVQHDGFAARFEADGSGLSYAGYIGGAEGDGTFGFEDEAAFSVEVDSSFNAYVSGKTTSSQISFPDGDGFDGVPGFDQTFAGATQDGFVVKVNPAGSALTGATYIGGDDFDGALDAALESGGSLLVSGFTTSNQLSFPVTTDFLSDTHAGATDTFVARLNGALTTLVNAGYIGGSGEEFNGTYGSSIAVGSDGSFYTSGYTDSTELSFPVMDGPDLTFNGGTYDSFVTKASAGGNLLYSGFVGGEGDDLVDGITVSPAGEVWLATQVEDFSTSYPNGNGLYSIPGYNQTNGGFADGGLVRVSEIDAEIVIVESAGSTNVSEDGATDTYTVELASQPQSNVTVTLTPDAQLSVDVTNLTFDPFDWDVPQQVVVTAVDDALLECDHDGLISHEAASADLNYDGITADLTPLITDNEDCSTADPLVRIPGDSPLEQAINLSIERFGLTGSADCGVLARTDVLVDAFITGPLVNLSNCTLLLTETGSLDGRTLAELNRALNSTSKRVYIAGGENALSEAVPTALAAAGYTDLMRFDGVNRRHTAVLVADEIVAQNALPTTSAFFAEDSAFVDALAITAVAGRASDQVVQPILLNRRTHATLDEHLVDFVSAHPEIVSGVIIGGTAALPDAFENNLESRFPSMVTTRLAGADRFATNRAILDEYFTSPAAMVVARGDRAGLIGATSVASSAATAHFFSALLAGTFAASQEIPFALVEPNLVPQDILEYATMHAGTISALYIVGSLSDVSQEVEDQLRAVTLP